MDATIGHRVEAVFPYLCDPTLWRHFAPAAEFRRQIDGGTPRVGTKWMATDRSAHSKLASWTSSNFSTRTDAWSGFHQHPGTPEWSTRAWNPMGRRASERLTRGS